jgi:hypothetical protein
MKLRISALCVALVAAFVIVNVCAQDKPARSKTKESKPAAAEPDHEAMMKKWMEIATPGPQHKGLEAFAGEWEVESKWWMAPDAPPMESKGTSKVHSILGGRYVQEEHTGEMMGKPFNGIGITGYDNFKKKYVSFWIDDAGTGMFTSEGTADPAGKMFTFHGKMDDPMTGEKDKPMKMILRTVNANKRVFEMHDLSKGEKSLCGEMTYTRK